jgi:hypothetical protein
VILELKNRLILRKSGVGRPVNSVFYCKFGYICRVIYASYKGCFQHEKESVAGPHGILAIHHAVCSFGVQSGRRIVQCGVQAGFRKLSAWIV